VKVDCNEEMKRKTSPRRVLGTCHVTSESWLPNFASSGASTNERYNPMCLWAWYYNLHVPHPMINEYYVSRVTVIDGDPTHMVFICQGVAGWRWIAGLRDRETA